MYYDKQPTFRQKLALFSQAFALPSTLACWLYRKCSKKRAQNQLATFGSPNYLILVQAVSNKDIITAARSRQQTGHVFQVS